MVRSKEEIIASLQSVCVENTSDEFISLLEDLSDTLETTDNSLVEELKQQLIDTETSWRNKYIARFTEPTQTTETTETTETEEIETFEDLFE
jgi:hypothetical protein